MDKIISTVIYLVVFVVTIYLTRKELSKVVVGEISNENISRKEKILIWVLCLLNPVLAGAIFYYAWRKRIPVKARQANQISLLAFFIQIIIAFFLFLGPLNSIVIKKIPETFLNKYNEISSVENRIYALSLLVQSDVAKTTNDINQAVNLFRDATLKQDEAIADFNLMLTKTKELKIITNEIADNEIKADAVEFINLFEQDSELGLNILKLQKELIDKTFVYYKAIQSGQKVSIPTNISDLENQIQETMKKRVVTTNKLTVALKKFSKKTGLVVKK